LNLDIRDQEFWFLEAEKKSLRERIFKLWLPHSAIADVQDDLARCQNALAELEGTKARKIESDWEEMKLRGKG
jgi:hypothetical protein